jgi:hypothetical protein
VKSGEKGDGANKKDQVQANVEGDNDEDEG